MGIRHCLIFNTCLAILTHLKKTVLTLCTTKLNIKQRKKNLDLPLEKGRPKFYGKGPPLLLWAGPRATFFKLAIYVIPNGLESCVIFIELAYITNLAASGIIQAVGRVLQTSILNCSCVFYMNLKSNSYISLQ
jgi:hypothetical protein